MKFKKFFAKWHVYFYGLICIVANVLAVLSTNISHFPMPKSVTLDLWEEFLGRHEKIISSVNLLCYFIPVVLCVLYSMKAFRRSPADKEYIRVRVHIPGAFALRGITGWICNLILESVFLIIFRTQHSVPITPIVIPSLASYIFLSMFSFTLTYFTLETLNRNIVLPEIYPDGNISGTERMSLSSIKNIFLFYFFSAAVFPTSFLLIRIFCVKQYNIEIPDYSDFIYAGMLLFIGLILTILISRFFQKPLQKLTDSANQISNGNYDLKTVICSNDEMGVLGDSFNSMARSLKEKEFMRDTFGKIVTPQIRDYLLNENVALGGETVNVTVMFCDIRGFTTLSENMEPERIVSFLNEYFTGLEKCIASHNGVINKYIGDAVMALFGAPVRTNTHAKDAWLSACDMRRELVEMNKKFSQEGLPEIRFGIGLHTGSVLAGNIGATNRMEYTVIGDTVNTASRIEGLCKIYKKDLLISESTAKEIPGQDFVFVDESEIRGRKEKVRLFTDSGNPLENHGANP